MPRDVDFGRDLAQRLTEAYGGLITEVRFTYDSFLELDRLDEVKSYCIISTNLYEQIRETRAHWRVTCQLMLTLVSAVGPTDDEQWIDDWLESWDLLVRAMREMPILGKHKPSSIDQEDRYSSDMFHNNRRLVTQAAINYLNVEVI